MDYPIIFLALGAGIVLGIGVGWSLFGKGKKISASLQAQISAKERELNDMNVKLVEMRSSVKTQEAEAKAQAKEILTAAQLKSREMELAAQREAARVEEKEKSLDKKVQEVEAQRTRLEKSEQDIKEMQDELQASTKKHREALEKVASLSAEEGKKQLLTELEKEFAPYFAAQLKDTKKHMEEDVEANARSMIAETIQRYASEVASESTTTVVQLPSDEVKGRIIGKEGRNIIAFEQATGIDVIIDDTPGAVIISGYDLVRRYVAKLALEKLIEDGRIQPARIEEIVNKVKDEVGKMMLEFGKRAVEELGITGYPQDLLKIIGRLRFRTSYGQNILKHSVEMAHMGRIMAEEIGADARIVVEGCLLHDLGKALDHEVSGTHVEIGVEICKRFKVRPEVIHCVAAHHEDIPIASPEAFIVAAVDAISGARPGARRESMEAYIKRLTNWRDCKEFRGRLTRRCRFGRSRNPRVRGPGKVDDLQQMKLAKDIAKKIESELTYPGVIKVNVIRERRVEETAK